MATGLLGAGILLLIKFTLSSNKKGGSEFSALFKVLTNHVQMLALVLSFELEWPSQIQSLLSVL